MSAEDALADAFRTALETWPERGVPKNPEAWLLTVSRNRMRDHYKSAANRTRADLTDGMAVAMTDIDPDAIPDKRLELLFVCAHPAIDETVRTPMILQTVLGLQASEIGRAFLVPEAAMAQRLVRAKRKIKASAIPFAIPCRTEMPARLEAVLEAIYGAYALSIDGVSADADDLASEALYLSTLLAELLPEQAEVLGLASLLSFTCARSAARHSRDGVLVPLDEQDVRLWDARMISRAFSLLAAAQALNVVDELPGRFQIEAAIQEVHSERLSTGVTNWPMISRLYEALIRIHPTIGAGVAWAASVGMAIDAGEGLKCLGKLEPAAIEQFQPAWATRARLLELVGEREAALKAYRRAIDLSTNIPARRYLEMQERRIKSKTA